MKIFSPEVSFFQTTTKPCFRIASAPEGKQFVHIAFKNGSFFSMLDSIGNGFFADSIATIKSNKGGYDKNKIHLPCFTPSGTFRIRCDWDIMVYSNIVHLDYDDVDVIQIRERFRRVPFVMAYFVSPSGSGLKVFVRVNTDVSKHFIAWTQVRQQLDDIAGVKSDPTSRNLSRLCYVSFDPDIYINPDADVFSVSDIVKTTTVVPDPAMLASGSDKSFNWLFNLTMKGRFQGEMFTSGYSKSERNKFLYLFACNCNRYGIDKMLCYQWMQNIWIADNDGFSVQELKRTCDSAYSNFNEYSTYRLPKTLQ